MTDIACDCKGPCYHDLGLFPAREGDMRLFLYTDGGSRGNPGPSAIGGIAYDVTGLDKYIEGGAIAHDREVFRFSERLMGHGTNNEAEYKALIRGLAMALDKSDVERVDCFLDSQLVVRQLNGQWQINSQTMRYFVKEVDRVRFGRPARVTFNWIARENNAVADRLVNAALDAKNND